MGTPAAHPEGREEGLARAGAGVDIGTGTPWLHPEGREGGGAGAGGAGAGAGMDTGTGAPAAHTEGRWMAGAGAEMDPGTGAPEVHPEGREGKAEGAGGGEGAEAGAAAEAGAGTDTRTGTPAVCPCQDLPVECIARILSFCRPRSICRGALVCRAWARAAQSDVAWSRHLPPREGLDRFFPGLAKSGKRNRRITSLEVFNELRREGAMSADRNHFLSVDPVRNSLSFHVSLATCQFVAQCSDTAQECAFAAEVPGSLFPQSLSDPTWRQVSGRVSPGLLLPAGRYAVSLRVGRGPRGRGTRARRWILGCPRCTITQPRKGTVVRGSPVRVWSGGSRCFMPQHKKQHMPAGMPRRLPADMHEHMQGCIQECLRQRLEPSQACGREYGQEFGGGPCELGFGFGGEAWNFSQELGRGGGQEFPMGNWEEFSEDNSLMLLDTSSNSTSWASFSSSTSSSSSSFSSELSEGCHRADSHSFVTRTGSQAGEGGAEGVISVERAQGCVSLSEGGLGEVHGRGHWSEERGEGGKERDDMEIRPHAQSLPQSQSQSQIHAVSQSLSQSQSQSQSLSHSQSEAQADSEAEGREADASSRKRRLWHTEALGAVFSTVRLRRHLRARVSPLPGPDADVSKGADVDMMTVYGDMVVAARGKGSRRSGGFGRGFLGKEYSKECIHWQNCYAGDVTIEASAEGGLGLLQVSLCLRDKASFKWGLYVDAVVFTKVL